MVSLTPLTPRRLWIGRPPPKPLACQVSDDEFENDDGDMEEMEEDGDNNEGEEESPSDRDESPSHSPVPELPPKELEHREKAFRLLALAASWFLVVQSRFHCLT